MSFRRIASLIAPAAVLLVAACSVGGGAESSSDDIVGGVDASSAALNAVGALGRIEDDGTFKYFCTASLIASDVVLTAKHCAGKPNRPPYSESEAIHFAVGPDSKAPLRKVKIKRTYLSPIDEGGFVERGSDVAVMILDEPITDIEPLAVAPAHLPESDVGIKVSAVGYGVRDNDKSSGVRMAGTLTLQAVSGSPMKKIFPTFDEYFAYVAKHDDAEWIALEPVRMRIEEFYHYEMMPSYEVYAGMGEGDAQPCSGDSGGPLLRRASGKLEIVAVVSGSKKGSLHECSVLGEMYASLGPEVQAMLRSAKSDCKGFPIAGQCDGDVTTRCVDAHEGPMRVTRTDCALLGLTCGQSGDGKLGCVDPQAADGGADGGFEPADGGGGDGGGDGGFEPASDGGVDGG